MGTPNPTYKKGDGILITPDQLYKNDGILIIPDPGLDLETYFLRTRFSSGSVELVNGKTYIPAVETPGVDEIAVQWMRDGEFTSTIVDDYKQEFVDGYLKLGNTGPAFDSIYKCNVISQEVTFVTGRVFNSIVKQVSGFGGTGLFVGIIKTATWTDADAEPVALLDFTDVGVKLLAITGGVTTPIVIANSLLTSTDYNWVFVIDETVSDKKIFLYLDGALQYIIQGDSETDGYFMASCPIGFISDYRFKNMTVGETLRPELIASQFSQTFDSSTGGGAVGGETSDPTELTDQSIQIISGKVSGFGFPVASDQKGSSTINNLLTNSIPNGAYVTVDINPNMIGDNARIYVEFWTDGAENNGTPARAGVAQWVDDGATQRILIKDGVNVLKETPYNDVEIVDESTWQISINLLTNELNIFNVENTLTDNIGADMSQGGAFESTGIGDVRLIIEANSSFGSTLDKTIDNLKVYPLFRSI